MRLLSELVRCAFISCMILHGLCVDTLCLFQRKSFMKEQDSGLFMC